MCRLSAFTHAIKWSILYFERLNILTKTEAYFGLLTVCVFVIMYCSWKSCFHTKFCFIQNCLIPSARSDWKIILWTNIKNIISLRTVALFAPVGLYVSSFDSGFRGKLWLFFSFRLFFFFLWTQAGAQINGANER